MHNMDAMLIRKYPLFISLMKLLLSSYSLALYIFDAFINLCFKDGIDSFINIRMGLTIINNYRITCLG